MINLCRSPILCLALIAVVMILGLGPVWKWPGLVDIENVTTLRDTYYASWLLAIAVPSVALSHLVLRNDRYLTTSGVWLIVALGLTSMGGPWGFRVAEIIGQAWLLWLWIDVVTAQWRTARTTVLKSPADSYWQIFRHVRHDATTFFIACLALGLHGGMFLKGLVVKALDTGWTPEMPDSDERVGGYVLVYVVTVVLLVALIVISWLAERERRA